MYSAAPNGAPGFSMRKTVKSVLGFRSWALIVKVSFPTVSVVRSTVTLALAWGKHCARAGEDGFNARCACAVADDAGLAVGADVWDAGLAALAYAEPPRTATAAKAADAAR